MLFLNGWSEDPENFRWKKELVITEDGSHTIYSPDFHEHYHSIHGAIQESRHIFIEAGLNEILKKQSIVNIFEMGFGTGLNAFLSYVEAEKNPIKIHYTALESYPLPAEIFEELNYGAIIEKGKFAAQFILIHNSTWDEWNSLSPNFNLKKIHGALENFKTEDKYDLVYFDAFAPDIQPELWTEEVFIKLYSFMNQGGILVTYSSKGAVKRSMIAAEFKIEKLPGPPGKREILRAMKI